MKKMTIRDVDLNGKTVIMRVDFNVPVENGKVTDDTRIVAALPTIKYAVEHNAKVILLSHLGRPKGVELKYSMKPVAEHLKQISGLNVIFVPHVVGEEVKKPSKRPSPRTSSSWRTRGSIRAKKRTIWSWQRLGPSWPIYT